MTRDRIRAQQAAQPPKPPQMVRVTVVTTSPLVVALPGGTEVPGIAVAGLTYTAGSAATALVQEPAIGPVFPHA